jgi:hypothetical protein
MRIALFRGMASALAATHHRRIAGARRCNENTAMAESQTTHTCRIHDRVSEPHAADREQDDCSESAADDDAQILLNLFLAAGLPALAGLGLLVLSLAAVIVEIAFG